MSPPKTPSPGIAIPSYNDFMGEGHIGGAQSSSSMESSQRYKGALHLTAETDAEFGVTKFSPNSASTAITRVENSNYAQFPACRSQLENSSNDSLQGLVLLHSQPHLDKTTQQHQPHPDYYNQGAHHQNWDEQHHQTIQPQTCSEYVERNSQRSFEDTTGDILSVARFDSVTGKNGTSDLTQQLKADTLSTPKQTNLVLPLSDESLSYLPRSAMGYVNPPQQEHNPWTETINRSAKMDRESERKEHDSDGHSAASTASATTASPIHSAMETVRYPEALVMATGSRGQIPVSAFGTPSTVSTVPSTDDVSIEGLIDPPSFERLTFKMDETDGSSPRISPRPHRYRSPGSDRRNRHMRSMSWENEGNSTHALSNNPHNQWGQASPRTSPSYGPMQQSRHVDAWSVGSSHVQVASFRGDQQHQQHQQMGEQNGQQHYGYPQVPHSDAWRQQRRYADPQQYYMSQQMAHLPPSGQYHHTRKGTPNQPMTPPRSARQTRPTQSRQSSPQIASSGPTASTNPPRSSSEVLKTLLRKKACLYEPDTSKAVALVTWLVGRELALEYGYFSRQQLQSGVHACVSNKIDSGAITRTKVNRCMQIILNSCFHYIIPRPDGSEENGDAFRKQFAETALDDQFLLKTLQNPWDDVTVDADVVIEASTSEEHHNTEKKFFSGSPHGSPTLKSSAPPLDGHDDDGDHKRAVLLCFNENVRSAEDVFLCHNEFIRDTANASKLQLTANEWRTFFGKDSGSPSLSGAGSSKNFVHEDFLGEMDEAELNLFRTSWCSKRYDHEHELCGFSHVEVSGGWLRRSPLHHTYRPEMCQDVIAVQDDSTGSTKFFLNQCCHGTNCPMAHSKEEVIYHPSSYKKRVCKASSQAHGCALGDVCPDLHQNDLQHNTKKPSNDYRASHQRHNINNNNNNNNASRHYGHQQAGSIHSQHGQHSSGGTHQGHRGGMTGVTPIGAPMLYVSPAPCSQFEKHLQMPGLQNLFRRHCSVLRAHLRSSVQKCQYSNFGDDWGIGTALTRVEPVAKQQLPTPRVDFRI